MKKFLSILIALALLVGIFAMTTIAMADTATPSTGDGEGEPAPETERSVKFNMTKFKEYVDTPDLEYYIEKNRSFMFENKWWEDADKVHEIFEGINYNVLPKVDTEGKTEEEKHTVSYTLGEKAADGESDKPAYNEAKYWETENITLPAAPTAITTTETVESEEKEVPTAYFNGWKIVYADEGLETPVAQWRKEALYKAGDKISMPDCDIEIVAQWVDTEDEVTEKVADDKIYVLYVSASEASTEDMKDWSRCLVTSTFSLTSDGEWNFRFAVLDGAKAAESGYTFDYDDVLATTFDAAQEIIDAANSENKVVDDKQVEAADCTMTYQTKDDTPPQIELSTTQSNKVNDGLTVGTTYTVSTSLDITDASSTTVTYVVYKKVGTGVEGADSNGWLQIYDSVSREVAEGYEENISTSGVITPLAEDVTDDDVYRIVYTVVDSYGNHGVKKVGSDETASTEEYHPVMLLKVKAEPVAASKSPIEVWKIVLYVIAGLSALGIIVLLFIKPKQATNDARYNSTNTETSSQSENSSEDASEEDKTE